MLIYFSIENKVTVKKDSLVISIKIGEETFIKRQAALPSARSRKVTKLQGMFIIPVSKFAIARLSSNILHGVPRSLEVARTIITNRLNIVVGNANIMFAHEHE